METENKMGTQPILKLILSMSVPAMFSMLVQAMYNVVDSFFVAQMGEAALTSVSLAFPMQMLMISVAVGTGVGINSLISRRLGEKKQEEANCAATQGLLLGIFSWMVFAVLGFVAAGPFMRAFTQDAQIQQMGIDYLQVVLIFSFGSFLQVNMEKTLQATGNMLYPMFSQLIGAVTNIILDPILIFGLFGFPKMGVKGAAVATVLGQILGMCFCLYVVFFKKHQVEISLKKYRIHGPVIKQIYAVGFPSIIMQAIGSVTNVCMNAILITFSDAAVSVLGVYFKLQSFVFMPVFGLNQGVMPIMGYNYGARKKDRLMSALKYGTIIAVGVMAIGTVLFWTLPELMLHIFNASPAMMEIGPKAFRLISLCFLPAAAGIMFSSIFQAVGMGGKSLLISLLRQLIVLVPAGFLLSKLGLIYVWYAWPIAEVISLLASIFILYRVYKARLQYLDAQEIREEMPVEAVEELIAEE